MSCEMRRFKQQLPETEMIRVLKDGKTAVLGVSGDDGYPYTVPINYAYADGKIYFHQAKSGHKYDPMKRCGKVSLCVIEKDDVVAEEFTAYYRSVIVFGRTRILENDEEIFHAAQVLSLKYYNDQDVVKEEIQKAWKVLSYVEITIEHMTGKEAIELTRMRTEENQS